MHALRDSMIGNLTQGNPKSCSDIPDWTNGYNCRAEGFRQSQKCEPDGWTCEAYELWNWCRDGNAIRGNEFALGEQLNKPEKHCCACGGGRHTEESIDWSLYEHASREDSSTAHENGFFLYDCTTHCGYMNSPRWNSLSNGFL